ncbi:uncharacterized protein SPAPADRAFT_62249 [Spathaspora passalidarum NRRL Y-27907]|uniref:WSC domain-containing protein n=1 Tax=Spathaspora passalidarum (strain NRRL Y-27907 / 11-Y1) TaxID=619300 RepID=G3AQU1_SPAPN|nr:uncharacterized protein SPAPADRAFT_62249 [Spathaspora passalidarum NRRL Y-27907]EGW31638.1 hypothetical protein SPAPADRAFT_62249 [Spathaspora passalidarum NRRL Y-27907]
MKYLYKTLILFLAVISLVKSDDAPSSLIGCFGSASGQNKGSYEYQTSSYCSKQCSNSQYIAVKGQQCICLDSLPSNKVSNSQCSTPCPGYGTQNCGGNNAYSVFQGPKYNADDSPNSESSDAPSSSTSDTSSSVTSPPTSSSTGHSYSTTTSSGSVIVKTITKDSPTPTETEDAETSTATDGNKDNKKKESKTNVGAIAGGVVGGVLGAGLIGALIVLWLKKRNDDDDYDEEEFFEQKPMSRHHGSTRGTRRNKNPLDMPMSNPFVDPHERTNESAFVDPRVNPIMMGRRRLSEGSLVDAADYSRKVLQVANPDS